MNQPTSSSPIRDQAGGCTSSISRPSQCGCLDAWMFEACVASTASLPCAETPWQEEQPSGSAQPTYPKPYNVYVYIHIYIHIQTYIYICCARRASVSTPSLRRREIYTLSNTRTHTHIYMYKHTDAWNKGTWHRGDRKGAPLRPPVSRTRCDQHPRCLSWSRPRSWFLQTLNPKPKKLCVRHYMWQQQQHILSRFQQIVSFGLVESRPESASLQLDLTS